MAQSEGATWQPKFSQCGLGQIFRALVTRGAIRPGAKDLGVAPVMLNLADLAKFGGFNQIWALF
jgi:hypothetical protein